MAKKTQPIPEGYHTVTPYLIVKGASDAIAYYKKAFGAQERMRMPCPDTGKVMHAELQVGTSVVMLADEFPQMGAVAPGKGGAPVSMCLYVPDCDSTFKKAIKAGGKALRPLADQFYGDRSGTLQDPFGHRWTISTHQEDVSDSEIAARMKTAFGDPCAPKAKPTKKAHKA